MAERHSGRIERRAMSLAKENYYIGGQPGDNTKKPPKQKKENFVTQNGRPFEFQFYENFEYIKDLHS